MKNLTYILLLLCSLTQAQPAITKMEYWIDTDPGFGNANDITGFSSQTDVKFQLHIPPGQAMGMHSIGLRAMDANGIWSHTNFIPVYITDSSSGAILQVEYFWDSDPGFGSATDSILSTPVADIANGVFTDSVPLSFLVGSTHMLFQRSMDTRGRWSHTNYASNLTVTGVVTVEELQKETGLNIYPNPFCEALTIIAENNKPQRFILYDECGKKVLDQLINGEAHFNTSLFPCGMYTAFICDERNNVYHLKLIKQ